jgi:hypothetical protein
MLNFQPPLEAGINTHLGLAGGLKAAQLNGGSKPVGLNPGIRVPASVDGLGT